MADQNPADYPIGTNAFPAFERNVENLDTAIVDRGSEKFPDRKGVQRYTYHGIEQRADRLLTGQAQQFNGFMVSSKDQFQRFIESSGFSGWDRQYGPGIELNAHNEGFTRCEPDETACLFYTPRGDTPLPYTTTGDWSAESSLFVVQNGDAPLRQDLSLSSKGSNLVAFRGSTVYEKLNKLKDISDFPTTKEAIDDAIINNNVVYALSSISIRIPQDADTLQTAVDRVIPVSDNVRIDLVISSGHKPASGIKNVGRNLSSFSVLSESGPVYLDSTFPPDDDFISAFYGRAPSLSCLVVANQYCRYGYFCDDASLGYVSPGSGVTGANSIGLYARDGSTIIADETVWTGTGSGIDASGILAWAARIAAYNADVSGSAWYGAQAAASGALNFRSGKSDNCARHGIRATNGGTVNAPYASAKNCGVSGFRAFDSGKVNADFSVATGSQTGYYAEHNSSISCREANADNCNIAVYSSHGSNISGHLIKAENSISSSVSSSYGGAIDVSFGTLSCSGDISLAVIEGGLVLAPRATISNTSGSKVGAIHVQGGELNASFSNFSVSGSGRMVTVRRGGKLVMNAAVLTKPTDGDVLWLDGGSFISATGCGILQNEVTGPYNAISTRGIVFA